MAYNTFLYFGLFLGAAYLGWLVAPARRRPLVLLAFSLLFYWLSAGRYILWFVAAAVITWAVGLTLGRLDELVADAAPLLPKPERKAYKAKVAVLKRSVLGAGCLLLLGCLVWLKYSPFLRKVLVAALARVPLFGWVGDLPVPHWVLPLGISFYTLMALGYLVDVSRGVCPPARRLWQVLLYLSFWPHIVEGPFDRYRDLAPTLLAENQHPTYQNLAFGAQRILWGLFKKVVVADRANAYVKAVFDDFVQYSGGATLLGTLLYTLQLYAEFSGCMDIVLGSAEIFGIPLAENFRQPFFASSIGEFWRRWHSTLGAWLREYLFQPFIMSKPVVRFGRFCRAKLGPAAGRTLPVALGLTVTWAAIGLWHGAGWVYLVYGLYYCALQLLGQAAEPWLLKAMPGLPAWRKTWWYKTFQIGRTFLLVNVGMLLFRSNGMANALYMLRHLAVKYNASLLIKVDARDMAVLALGAALILLVDVLHERGVSIRRGLATKPLPLRWAAYIGGVLLVLVFGAYGDHYDPAAFIYAQF
ncbi:MAG: MBOAT family protein [Gemmiger sp.]|nr:MBOAT family protein [Gemmiger sp.]